MYILYCYYLLHCHSAIGKTSLDHAVINYLLLTMKYKKMEPPERVNELMTRDHTKQ